MYNLYIFFIVEDQEKNVTSSMENFRIKFQICLLNFLFVYLIEGLTFKIINLFVSYLHRYIVNL